MKGEINQFNSREELIKIIIYVTISQKESERIENEKRLNMYITIVASLIKPCPTPKDLGFSFDEYRIEKYKTLLYHIKRKYEDKILGLFLLIMMFIWFEGANLINLIFDEGLFYRYILGNGLLLLWSFFLILLFIYFPEKLSESFAKWKFNRLNQKGLLTEDIIKYDPSYTSVEKFSKEEISQIKKYIFYRGRFMFIVSETEDIVKQNFKNQ